MHTIREDLSCLCSDMISSHIRPAFVSTSTHDERESTSFSRTTASYISVHTVPRTLILHLPLVKGQRVRGTANHLPTTAVQTDDRFDMSSPTLASREGLNL